MLRLLATRRTPATAALFSRRLSAAAANYAAAPYRAMDNATDEQLHEWAAADDLLHARMKEFVPAALEHNGEEEFAQRELLRRRLRVP